MAILKVKCAEMIADDMGTGSALHFQWLLRLQFHRYFCMCVKTTIFLSSYHCTLQDYLFYPTFTFLNFFA